MDETTTLRMGSTTFLGCERIPDGVLEDAYRALTAYRRGDPLPGTPDEATLRARCSDCAADGIIGGSLYGSACRHRAAFIAIEAERHGLDVLVRKPAEVAVA